jgi:S-adenosylmethionine:tRNA ribosyltransferase-isomerase
MTGAGWNTADYDYVLPQALIAQTPAEARDHSRLLVLHRQSGALEHRFFYDLPAYLRPGDVLVLNDSAVVPARLFGVRESTGARVEILLLRPRGDGGYEALAKPARRVKRGDVLVFGGGRLRASVEEEGGEGMRTLRFDCEGDFYAVLDALGEMPLPPYIHQKPDDPSRYQTVYANERGSAAAPTAGLHFTQALLEKIAGMGVEVHTVMLHVGLGTFRPVGVEDIRRHRMHAEYFVLPEATARAVNDAKARNSRVIAVGTTSVRVLESCADKDGRVRAQSGWTEIFIYPGVPFRCVDAMVTNFHLPQSTLLMLVSAFAGNERIRAAYAAAVAAQYRFFSFGDAMLIID